MNIYEFYHEFLLFNNIISRIYENQTYDTFFIAVPATRTILLDRNNRRFAYV